MPETAGPPIDSAPAPSERTGLLSTRRVGPLSGYLAATVLTVGAILSQYFLPELVPAAAPAYQSLAGDVLIVYGVPILAFVVLVGLGPLRNWRGSMATAAVQGVSWYGILSLLGLFVALVLIAIFAEVEPGLLPLLSRPNPDLTAAASNPWFYVGFSFVVGAFEETIFRGWIFGYWLARGTPRWGFHAVWTSVLFAGVHLYYATTYGAAATVLFPTLFLTGLAFAITVKNAKGNLVMVAFLHGWNDATAFLMLISVGASLLLHYGMILAGVVVFVVLWLRSRATPPPSPGFLPPVPLPPPPSALEVGSPVTSDRGPEPSP